MKYNEFVKNRIHHVFCYFVLKIWYLRFDDQAKFIGFIEFIESD